MIRSFWAIAFNGFREARRNRVTLVLAFFAGLLLLSSSLITDITVVTFDRVLIDIGLAGMSLILVLLAIFLSTGLLSREIERRTIFMVVTKPVSRGLFLVARLAGNMVTLTALQILMGALLLLEFKVLRTPVTEPTVLAMGMLWFELLVLSALGFLMSSFAGPMTSAFVTVSMFFVGHLSGDIYMLARRSKNVGLQVLGKVLYYVLPNLERLNLRAQASYGIAVPSKVWVLSGVYALGYAAVLIWLAVLLFRRRDFR
jgi:ABC-type transport system involved in multi-copper enzyme maturation permease subunit